MSGLELNCEQWPGFNLAKQITPSDARICTAISLLPRPQRPGTTGGEDGLASAPAALAELSQFVPLPAVAASHFSNYLKKADALWPPTQPWGLLFLGAKP